MELSNELLRSLLDAALSREELIELCFDHFPELHEDAEHQTKQKTIRSLITWCRNRDLIGKLVDLIKQKNPVQYDRYSSYITRDFSTTGPGLVRITVEIPNDQEQIAGLLRNLAGLLETRDEIRLVKVEMGSLKLTVVLPAQTIDRLLSLQNEGDGRLTEFGLEEVRFVQPDLANVSLPRAYLGRSSLSGADFRSAKLSRAWLNRANLIHADFRGAELDGANLYRSDLRYADLSGANLFAANLNMARLLGATLVGTMLLGADLLHANLRNSDMREAILKRSNLHNADLSNANLQQANLNRATLTNANLSEADLDEADLREADMREVNLVGVDLSQALLKGADLRRVHLDRDQLFWAIERGAIIDDLLFVRRLSRH